MKFSKNIEYKRKDDFTEVVHCRGIRGFFIWNVIRFVNWLERKEEGGQV